MSRKHRKKGKARQSPHEQRGARQRSRAALALGLSERSVVGDVQSKCGHPVVIAETGPGLSPAIASANPPPATVTVKQVAQTPHSMNGTKERHQSQSPGHGTAAARMKAPATIEASTAQSLSWKDAGFEAPPRRSLKQALETVAHAPQSARPDSKAASGPARAPLSDEQHAPQDDKHRAAPRRPALSIDSELRGQGETVTERVLPGPLPTGHDRMERKILEHSERTTPRQDANGNEATAGEAIADSQQDRRPAARQPSPDADDGEPKKDSVTPERRSRSESAVDKTAGGGSNLPPIVRPRGGDGDFRENVSRGIGIAKSSLITVGIFSLVLNLLILVMPIYLFQISDRVLTSHSTDTLIMLTAVVIGAVALHSLLDMFRRIVLMRVAVQVETTLGPPILSAATKAAQHGSAREFSAIMDLQQIRNFMTGPVLLNMFDAPIAPVYFLAVYLIHPDLGLILIVAALVLTSIALLNQRITAVPFARANAFTTRAAQQAEAMARNALVVNALGMIREGVMLWGRETAEALKAQVRAQDLNMMMTAITKFARLATQIAILGWGAWLALQTELTGGTMIAASIIASRALSPVEGLIEGWRSFVQARGGYARIQALLASSPLNQEHLLLPRPQGRLSVDRVLYVPPPTKRVILNGVNFDLEPGESIAIVGPSGAGKSTLARMLVGSLTPTSGSIRLDLMDIRNWDPRQFGETIGYLPQDVQLFPGTIKANIARMREDVTDESVFDAATLAGVHELIAQLPTGYETQISIDGSPLSGGQRQRVALARAFFGMPRLVVLDEPNSNLDSAGEQALARALLEAKRRGITVVAVTQRPALLKSVDKIMALGEGKVGAIGPREEMLTRMGQGKGQAAIAA